MTYSLNPSMKELSETICSQVGTITMFLDSQSVQQPSFRPDAPSTIPEDKNVQAARIALIEAASDLILLAQGPAEFIRNEAFVVCITAAVFPIYTNSITRKNTMSLSLVSLTVTMCGMRFLLMVRSPTMMYLRRSVFPVIVFDESSDIL